MKIVTTTTTSATTTMKGLLGSTIISLILLSSLLTVQATDAIDNLLNELLNSGGSAGVTDTETIESLSSSSSTVSSSSSNSRAAFDVFATTTLLAAAADSNTDTSNTVNFNKAAWERVKSLQCFFLQKDAGLCTGSIDADGYTILCSYCTLTKEGMDDAGLKSSDDVEQVCVPSFSKDMLIDEHKVTECVDADPTTDEEHDEWLRKKQDKEDKEKKDKKEKEEKAKEKKKKKEAEGRDDDDYVVIQTDDKYNDDNAVFRHYKKMMAHDDDGMDDDTSTKSRDDEDEDDDKDDRPSNSKKKNSGVRGHTSTHAGSRQSSAMLWLSNRPLMKLAWPRLFG